QSRSVIEQRELLLVKQEYRMSMMAVLYRLLHTNVIKPSLFQEMLSQFREQGWDRCEPGDPLPSEKPHVFEQMLFHALGEGYVSQAKAAELLAISCDALRKLRSING